MPYQVRGKETIICYAEMKRIYTTAVNGCERKSTLDVKNSEQYKATA